MKDFVSAWMFFGCAASKMGYDLMPLADATSLRSLSLLRTLVGFQTVSRESNLPLIEYVRDYLQRMGVESRLVFHEEGRKANLFATLGPADRPGIVLSGHTDVVPVDGQEWSCDPFTLSRRGSRFLGRGVADMKGFLAVALASAPRFLERDLQIPIHFALSCDEEVGCVGVRPLIRELAAMPVKPAMCFVGEPTSMNVVVAHKGKKYLRVHVHGFECHSSVSPRGVNAVEYAAEAIAHIRSIGRELAARGPFDQGYDVPHTTAHVGVVNGGTALNIVPKDCRFDFEFRHLPEDDPEMLVNRIKAFVAERLEPEMRAVRPETGFEWQEMSAFPGMDTPESTDVVRLAKALTGSVTVGKVAYGTEAGMFSAWAGIPTVICGPGDIDQAHKPDEYIEIDQLAACEAFMNRLADRVHGLA